MNNFIRKNRPSIWLITAALIMAATQMHPSFTTLVVVAIVAALLFSARWLARRED